MPEVKEPLLVDRHVGARIRARRHALQISQERLADIAGVTFQQIQKYERGANRVSASKMWLIARALEVPVGYLFDGLADEDQPASTPEAAIVDQLALSRGGLELAAIFIRLPAKWQTSLLNIARSLADEKAAA